MPFSTQQKVDGLRLPAGKKEHWEFDQRCTGLSIRLQGKNSKTFVVWYTAPDRKRRKVWIGDVAGMRLDEARRKATEIVNGAKAGQDAVAERRVAREAAKAKTADTLGRLIASYLEQRAKPAQRPRSYLECERHLLKGWKPLHGRPVDSVTRRDVAAEIERVRVERGPTAANHARVYLSGCYAWAMKQGLAEGNPVVGTEAPARPPTPTRVLPERELALIWHAAGDDDFGRIVKLLMLTGQRRDEIGAMAWSEIDLDRKLWTIPGRRTKNRRDHEIPLSDAVLDLLPAPCPGRDLLFGRRAGAFSGFSHAKARLDQRILERRREADPKAKAIPAWRLHDLRHSFVTHANEIGIEPHVIEAAVNHQSGFRGGIAGRYNAAAYREQKRAAMQRFAGWLEGVVSGEQRSSNVVRAFG